MDLEFNLAPVQEGFSYTPATVRFSDYERIKGQAEDLNMILNQVQVSEENLKLAKKLVAEVRKQYNVLDQQRKDAKKAIMGNFSDYESKVKEIGFIVSEGENLVRGKIRELEEIERDEKASEIKELWDEHSTHYDFVSFYGYDEWFEPRLLNKTQSVNKTEEELVQWLQRVQNDMKVIDSQPEREDLMLLYKSNQGDLSKALIELNKIQEQRKQVELLSRVEDRMESEERTYTITLYSEDTYHKVLKWLQDNDIDYTKEVK